MPHYNSAYELGLDFLDLQLCLDTDLNQPDYDGSRQTDPDEPQADDARPETTTP